MWKNKWCIHLWRGLRDDKERWMDDKEDEQKCERVNKWRGGLIGDVCAV